jgi:hypothetical protein
VRGLGRLHQWVPAVKAFKISGALLMMLGGPTCSVGLAMQTKHAFYGGVLALLIGLVLFTVARLSVDH